MSTDQCPFLNPAAGKPHVTNDAKGNRDWWPHQLNVNILHQFDTRSDPMGEGFDYAEQVKKLDVDQLKKDMKEVLTTSQDWWPADYGHYGGLMIRLSWHAAGTYRVHDGRGGGSAGQIRFAPLNSWPDNANLDKARRLLWPIKKKYGKQLSWADLILFAGNEAMETMGFKTFGFAFGREDVYEPEQDVYWGPESEWLGDERYSGDRELETPLGAVQMGLIYVNPEGPNGNPDPAAAAHDIRETFGRMAMNDEETVALIAGGHTFGKVHGASPQEPYVGPEPEGAPMEQQGLGWKSSFNSGKGDDTYTSGLEGPWTRNPVQWDHDYFQILFDNEWELTKSPGGANQWTPKPNGHEVPAAPKAHDPAATQTVMMLTTDLALRVDPDYEKISRRFMEHPEQFEDAYARAWYKLLHRDMGPHSRLLGPEVPEPQLWQDPVPEADHGLIDESDIKLLKEKLLDAGLTTQELIVTAWGAAASFRSTDKRGGANGGRIRLEPQKSWACNEPDVLAKTIPAIEKVQDEFNAGAGGGKKVSFADLVVLGGCAAIEKAARDGGVTVTVPFTPGRTDATADMTDAQAMAVLETTADGFRNYLSEDHKWPAEQLMLEKARLLDLTGPEMTVLVGGMRALNANYKTNPAGVLTDKPGTLTNDFFVNLLDMSTQWEKSDKCDHVFVGKDPESGERKWMASSVDLALGYHSQLRAYAEVYAADDAQEKFVHDFAAAWDKVMMADRFDVK